MNATQDAAVDPVLQRLHELTARIRRRAAQARAQERARSARRPRTGQGELPLVVPARSGPQMALGAWS